MKRHDRDYHADARPSFRQMAPSTPYCWGIIDASHALCIIVTLYVHVSAVSVRDSEAIGFALKRALR